MNLFCKSALGVALAASTAMTAAATELTIAIVNNGHMLNMQKVAEAGEVVNERLISEFAGICAKTSAGTCPSIRISVIFRVQPMSWCI